MDKQLIFFDLDGTLTDSGPGIIKSVQYALASFGIAVDDPEKLRSFIGPPLYESFMKVYGFDEAGTHLAIEKYREYFSVTGIYENRVYDGITDLLQSLTTKGKTLAIATSKATVFAQRIAEHFDFARYFSFIAGSELEGTRITKEEIVAYALQQLSISDLSHVVMVGDRKHDVRGAAANGIDSIGVLYGYGDRDELESAGAGVIAASVADLAKILGA